MTMATEAGVWDISYAFKYDGYPKPAVKYDLENNSNISELFGVVEKV